MSQPSESVKVQFLFDQLFRAIDIARDYGLAPGLEHKAWVVDQMVRAICNCENGEPNEAYVTWVGQVEMHGAVWPTGSKPSLKDLGQKPLTSREVERLGDQVPLAEALGLPLIMVRPGFTVTVARAKALVGEYSASHSKDPREAV